MGKKDTKPFKLNINLDTTPVLFTDNIIITTNKYGVVLNSTQQIGPTNQTRIVSRIGMSRVHARHFVEELGKLLAITEGHTQTGDNKKN